MMPNRRMILPILAAVIVIGGMGGLALTNATLINVVAGDQQVIRTLSQNNDALRQQVKDSGETPVAPPADAVTDAPSSSGQQGDRGPRGEKGDPGSDGANGVGTPGTTGAPGVSIPGRDGSDGVGVDGKDGKDGTNGTNGLDGKDGALPSPLVFAFPSGNVYTCNLNSTTSQYDCVLTGPPPLIPG